jgi:prepilin-type N-terminal cleavage/methylation domain-containing protein/prepilin-type processing-associated H-X9-DG protein
MRRFQLRGFTLVELLVVIGIIALLISILLPALNKARQQANLIYCSASMHSIGQAIQGYATENHGYTPAVWDTTTFITFADVLTVAATHRYATVSFPGQPVSAAFFEPDQDQSIFHDLDVPSDSWYPHSCAYVANLRVMGGIGIWDVLATTAPNHIGFKQRQLSGIRRASEKLMVWCGPCNINGGINYGCKEPFPDGLDNYLMWNSPGNGLSDSPPAGSSYTAAFYSNPISLGAGSGSGSSFSPPVLPATLKRDNVDNDGTWPSYGVNYMRFRHLNNKACNFLYVDGHVGSGMLGSVKASDICVNP